MPETATLERVRAIVPGVYAVAWRPRRRRTPGRWVQRYVIDLVEIQGRVRAEFAELDPLRTGQPARSSCLRAALAQWAEHVLVAPVALPFREELPTKQLELRRAG